MPRRLEDTPRPVVRAASAQAPSAAMTMAGRPEAIRHAEAPASVVEDLAAVVEDLMAAVAAGIGN